MTELLRKNIAKHVILSDVEFEKLIKSFELKTIQKKQFYLKEGDVCKYEGFVTNGLF